MRAKLVRAQSGVIVITVLTSPWPKTVEEDYGLDNASEDIFVKSEITENLTRKYKQFSCKYNCFFCPAEPGQPRSYLKQEPAVARANQHRFDAIEQFRDRGFT